MQLWEMQLSLDYLLDHCADDDIPDNKNNLPLHIACYLNNTEIIKFPNIATELHNKEMLNILDGNI
ncbi:hypothetical protein H8356DRAFT_1353874 [Neocallimastix lanati (nom. inval.)]|nr:hypothetical protein H8356DRAFT_1353874 [Neocallimastix sp. JGI-2020a]